MIHFYMLGKELRAINLDIDSYIPLYFDRVKILFKYQGTLTDAAKAFYESNPNYMYLLQKHFIEYLL